ncbi:unnamed protein product, partial [marine sediment metagenome]
FKLGDYLHNKQEFSVWPAIFDQQDLSPLYKSGTTSVSWGAILRGRLAAESAWEKGEWIGSNPRRDEIMELWEDMDADKAIESATITQWWNEGAARARKERQLNVLNASISYVFAHLLWWSNQGEQGLAEAPTRLANWPQLMSLKGRTPWGESRMFFRLLLSGINYRKQAKNRLHLGISF